MALNPLVSLIGRLSEIDFKIYPQPLEDGVDDVRFYSGKVNFADLYFRE